MLTALLLQSARFLPPTPLTMDGAPLSVPGGYAAPAFADLDGDGVQDLAVGFMKGGGFQVFIKTRDAYGPPSLLKIEDVPASVDTGCCIGSVPQFVDLDQDGRLDLVSGTYTQGVVLFRGRGDGFDRPVVIVERSVGSALSPAFADWDGDGDLDMVLGTQSGEVLLLTNRGGLNFADAKRLTSEGSEIKAPHGGPALFDFNADGAPDLLLGDASGNLNLYYAKSKGGTDFSQGKSVLPAFPRGPRPGINLKPTVQDLNGDGKPDIVVGDFRPDGAPVTPLPPDVEKEIERLTMASSAVAFQIFARSSELEEAAKKEAGIADLATATAEQRARYEAALTRLMAEDKRLPALRAQKAQTDRQLDEVRRQRPIEGTLWVLFGL